jgi:hypothetical protein
MIHRRTTRPPITDVAEHFPEIAGLRKPALRLFPRPELVMGINESKLGGAVIWPHGEEWPLCSKHHVPYVPLIQILKSDIPSLGFKPGTDLFQVIWCPHTHEEFDYLPAHYIYLRSTADLPGPFADIPEPRLNDEFVYTDAGEYVPTQCRFYPEPIVEYPVIEELADEVQEKLKQWDVSFIPGIEELQAGWVDAPFSPGEWLYMCELSVAGGTKVGGYPEWIQGPDYPVCACGKRMEHLLSISSLETVIGQEGDRWIPIEEKDLPYALRYQLHYGTRLMFGDGGIVYMFVCRECKEWPIRLVWQCG